MYMIPLSWALRQTLKAGYRLSDLKADILAAFVVSLIALPLSMALAIAIGLPPQHGIYTAIVAGIAAALFGGSLFQVSGPTAAFVVILIPIVTDFGLQGLIWCQILAGCLLILFSILKFGRFIHYIPNPVIIGFTSGIALVLASISLKDFMGLPKVPYLSMHFTDINLPTTFIGIMTLFFMLSAKRFFKFIPSPLLGVLGGTLIGVALSQWGYPIHTIGSEFSGGIPHSAPRLQMPLLPTLEEFSAFLFPAFTIAMLAALESLLSAKLADKMTGTAHHSNAELSGIGIANVLCGLTTGIPATAAIARTATNIQSGAKSPLAAILHGVFILLYILLLAPLINYIPMSALAAVLVLTAYHMSHWQQFREGLHASITDRFILLTCFLLTVCVDMVAAIAVGILLAALFAWSKRSIFN